MNALLYTLGVLVFALGVALSIGLHELGHLIPGKLFNVKVTQFFIGFGRTLWSTRRGETEYGVKLIPLGGYCKLVGMVPPNEAGREGDTGGERVPSRATGMFAQLVSDAKDVEYENVSPEDHDRLFYRLPWWKRVIIMGSGVAINVVLAFILFAIVFMGHGIAAPTTTVANVSDCVIAVTKANLERPPRTCRADDPVAPAKAAGFQAGDHIVSFNGRPISDWDQVQHEIRTNGSKRATVVVERDGRRVTLTPRTVVSPRTDLETGERIVRAGFLGVTPELTIQRQGVGFVVTTMGQGTWDVLKTIGALPQKLYHVARAALGMEQRDPNGLMSVVGAGRVAGEMAAEDDRPLSTRFSSLLLLLAGLNLFLGMINLVPLPPFDGGGIATTVYEAVRRRIARLRGRPDPGAVDAARLLPVTYVMAALILVMSIILVYADIVAPISLT